MIVRSPLSFLCSHPLQMILLTLWIVCYDTQALMGQQNDPASQSREVLQAMQRATEFMTSHVAVHGGYVYKVTLDLKHRKGEGNATPTEIWVQPPGTPEVGSDLLDAWEATHDSQFLDAAQGCAEALLFGQLQSGGWADRVDFDPAGKNTGRYRGDRGKSRGRNYSTLDDDKTQ